MNQLFKTYSGQTEKKKKVAKLLLLTYLTKSKI